MNRNQKIALGCGGAGCLGLIVLAAIGVFGYFAYMRTSSSFANSNGNRNYNFNLNTNSNGNLSENSNAVSDDANDTSSSSMSADDKHKLFQAAGVTKDGELILKVLDKIGFPSGTGAGYEAFVKEHFSWAMKNLDFIQTVNTAEKARAYVEAHIND